jgi:hypothetical protein
MPRPRTRLKNGKVVVDPIDEWASLIAARGDHFAAFLWRILLVHSSECARMRQLSSLDESRQNPSRLCLESGGVVELGDD